MFKSLHPVLKTLQALKLYLRKGSTKIKKEVLSDAKIETLTPHEKLIEAIEHCDISAVNLLYSLDTRENTLNVFGVNHQTYQQTVEDWTEILRRDFTLSRREVSKQRKPYTETTFFIGNDGYYRDRRLALSSLVDSFRAFAKEVARIQAAVDKKTILKHNLELAEIVVMDMLQFMESFNYVQPLSKHQVRHR